jgi:ribosomal protein L3 glutamine methyltransferase
MDLVRRILAESGAHLAPDGLLVVEVGQGRAVLERGYPGLPFLWFDTEHSSGEVFALPAAALHDGMPSLSKRGRTKSKVPKPAHAPR